MTRIAFLGLGAMGSRMAARLLDAGHDLTVWNRTPGRAADLVARGAREAAIPREAAAGAELAFAMVRDDQASEAVWLGPGGALAALGPESVGVECSTLSAGHVRWLHQSAAAQGTAFLDAPLAGSRPQAEAGQLVFMAGGAAEALDRARPVLLAMGGAVHHAGPPGSGALAKLMVNALFGTQVAALAELVAWAERAGLDPARAVEILGATPVASPAAKGAAAAMLARAFAPAFPIELVAKDFGLMAASGRDAGADLPVTGAAGAAFDAALREGLGEANITAVLWRYLDRARAA